MAYYDVQAFVPGSTSFIDTQDPVGAIRIAIEAYEQDNVSLYVLYRVINDFDSEPVSIILNDVVYDLEAVLKKD